MSDLTRGTKKIPDRIRELVLADVFDAMSEIVGTYLMCNAKMLNDGTESLLKGVHEDFSAGAHNMRAFHSDVPCRERDCAKALAAHLMVRIAQELLDEVQSELVDIEDNVLANEVLSILSFSWDLQHRIEQRHPLSRYGVRKGGLCE